MNIQADRGLTNILEDKVGTQFSSVQFKMVYVRSEKPICAPPRLKDVSPTSPLKLFQCSSRDRETERYARARTERERKRERERDRDRDRDTDRQTDRDRQRQTETETERHRETQRKSSR